MLKIKKVLFLEVIILMLCLTSCFSVSEDIDSMYYRENVKVMTKSFNFGWRKNDDIYVALSYIYNDADIRTVHGDYFEISSDEIERSIAEYDSFMFLWNYKGKALYTININESTYYVVLSKKYFGKWQVDECSDKEPSNLFDDIIEIG